MKNLVINHQTLYSGHRDPLDRKQNEKNLTMNFKKGCHWVKKQNFNKAYIITYSSHWIYIGY
jgi:hypothetical protein